MTPEQQRAIALANARRRQAQAGEPSLVAAEPGRFIPDEEPDLKPRFSFQLPHPQQATGGEALIQEIAGATAGTFIAPQLAVPKIASKLPGVGKALISHSPKIAGAGAGGGGLGGDPVEAMQGEITGVAAVNAIQKTLGPFAKGVSKKSKELLDFARQEGIPISPDMLNPSMTAKVLQGSTDAFLPSRLVNRFFRNKMAVRFNQLSGEIAEDGVAKATQFAGESPGREAAADIIQTEFGDLVSGVTSRATKLANRFVDEIGSDTKITINNTKAVLLDMQKNFKQKNLREFVDLELKSTTGTIKTAEDLDTLFKEIGQIKGVRSKGKLALTKLKDAIKQDLKEAGADIDLFSKSNQAFARKADLTNNKFLRDLANGDVPPQALTVRLFSVTNKDAISNIKKLKKNISPEAWEALKAQNITNLITNHSTLSTQLPGVRIINKGEKLARWVADNKKVLEEAYEPEQIKALESFVNLAKSSAKDIQKFESTLTGVAGSNVAILGGAGFGGLDVLDPMLIIPASSSPFIAKSLMNPNGLMNRWLTTGVQGSKLLEKAGIPEAAQRIVGEQGLRLGSRSVFQNGND